MPLRSGNLVPNQGIFATGVEVYGDLGVGLLEGEDRLGVEKGPQSCSLLKTTVFKLVFVVSFLPLFSFSILKHSAKHG